MSNSETMTRLPLYEKLALEISRQVEQGTFRPGDRIPSVRQVSRQRELSITTVLQAYQLLEDRGVIEARPQSGYYVRRRPSGPVFEPDMGGAPGFPCLVSIDDMVIQVLRDSENPRLVQFGAALPSPDLLPSTRLNRILASIARREEVSPNFIGALEGCYELRVQVARRAFLAGCEITPDEILITSGCTEALSLSLRAVCNPGDLIAIESPTYFGILQILESLGMQALEIPTHHRDGISLEALRFALDHHPVRACLFSTNFSNPLGCRMPDENKLQLMELLSERNIPLIEDDIYGELYFDGERPNVVKSLDRKGLIILCSSFSKDISPNYRVGWVAAGKFQERVLRLKVATNLSTSMLPQLAIAHYLESGGYDRHLRNMRRAFAERVSAMADSVLRHFPEDSRVTDPAGGCVLWVQMPENVDSLELYQLALKTGITLAPGYIFSASPKYRNYIRLNAAYWNWKADRSVETLGRLVKRLADRPAREHTTVIE